MIRDSRAIVLAGLSLAGGFALLRKDVNAGTTASTDQLTGGTERDRGVQIRDGGNGIEVKKRGAFRTLSAAALEFADLQEFSIPLREMQSRREKGLSASETTFQTATEVQEVFNSEVVLFRRIGSAEVSAMRVLAGEEQAAVDVLSRRSDVEFASVDTIQTRQFTPTDANLSFQWHHGSVDSFGAWEAGIGNGTVAVAIVDTAFQMNHPDLIQNVETGWDVVDEMPILTSAGEVHSTATAGMAGAVINNGVGVAGATNCRLVPVGITGATSEMYQAVLWAADHSIRVVNISWTGADDPVLQAAGEYLEARVQGVLVMPGLNSTGQAGFVNHSNIVCISMTDAADNVRSLSGPHIDFAAPGWDVYTTTINSTYATARGTSFAAPFFSGIVAMVMSINPALTAAQVIDVMRETADDKGHSGWDESYGWGRVNFRSAVEKTVTTLPRISSVTARSSRLEIAVQTAYPFYLTLERKDLIPESGWTVVSNQHSLAEITIFEDRSRSAAAMYRVRAEPARD